MTDRNPDWRRVLVVGPSWLGDMVLAQSLFLDLKRRHPGVRIDVAAPSWSVPVLSRMPEVDDAIEIPVPHGRFGLGIRRRIGRSLRARGYDHSIVIPRSFKSALIPWFAGIPHRAGHFGEGRVGLINDVRPRDATRSRPHVHGFLELGAPRGTAVPKEVPYPHLQIDDQNRRKAVEALGLSLERPVIACMPGAIFGPAKAWPEESFGALAARLVDEGKQVWILGSARDRESGARIREHSGGAAIDLCGRTSVEDVVDLLSLAEQAVTNDSGLMHVAAAVGTRVVAIYGSSTPEFTPPLTDSRSVLYLALECSPCFKRRCPYGHYRCLTEIPVDDVHAAIAAGG